MEGNARGKRKIIQSKNEPNKSKKKRKKKNENHDNGFGYRAENLFTISCC
jgi:hypothetical protein